MRTSIALCAAALFGLGQSIATISVKGSKFFKSDGSQYFIKGIAYQLTPEDPLVDSTQCKLDFSLMQTLGANMIRVYHVDPDADHSACMTAMANAGIYLFVDLDTFNTQINPGLPMWNQTQYEAFQKVMDEFQQYDNTAGFFIGNEVMTTGNDSAAAPYIKAAARDMKAYRDSKGYRKIPVGYSAADIASLRPNLQNFLACGNSSDALDFFSLNAYEWCGPSTYAESGYTQLNGMVTNYNIPIFFSETGCNTVKPRTFGDQSAIFGTEMLPYWSGSVVYEWIEEANNYGLISYGPKTAATATDAPDGYTRTGTPTPISPDFQNLSNQWKTLNPTGVSMSAYNPSNSAPACPAFTSNVWLVNGAASLPTIGQAFNAQVSSSITAGTATSSGARSSSSGTASASRSSSTAAQSGTSSASGSAASASATGMASPSKEIAGMSAGLVCVMIGFLWWL